LVSPQRWIPQSKGPDQSKKKKSLAVTEVQHYAVDYAIAGPQLHFVEQGEMRHGVFSFIASAFDDEGNALSRLASRTTADLKPSSYKDVMTVGFRIREEFDVPTNAASCAWESKTNQPEILEQWRSRCRSLCLRRTRPCGRTFYRLSNQTKPPKQPPSPMSQCA
jgi:hypothetical protein